jgi:hypothetical protein
MKKTILIIMGITLMLSLCQIASAYSTPDEYKPQNLQFGINFGETGENGSIAESKGEQGSFAAIIILQIIAGGLLYFAAPVGVIMIAFSAWQMVTGGADSEKLEQSKKHLTWTIIGLLVIILSYSAVRFAISLIFDSVNPPKPDQTPSASAKSIEFTLPIEETKPLLS